ncbi:Gfo/Idh/MocA family oxidoreductase [bacterium]|nr:Gfo/Idh/MocA family oxidoreductase [bacterium]
MIKIGLAGIGFMGMIHYLAIARISGAKVTAIAARDPKKRAGDWSMIQGNFGPRGTQMDLSDIALFADAEELIQKSDVDLVDICLPSDNHVGPAIKALESGKHVLVEKPIALSLADADRMVAAAKASGRMLMVAHVLPFFADFRFGLELISQQTHGKLLAAHFRRHISPPNWSDAVADFSKVGGPLIDLHIHDTHFIVVAFGKPRRVTSTGIKRGEMVTYVATQYDFGPEGPAVSATSGCLSAPGRPFTHGYELYFERATLLYEAGQPLRLFTATGVENPTLAGGDEIDAFEKEITAAVRAIETRTPSPLLDGTLARDALALCLGEGTSVDSGQPVSIA